MKFTLEDIPVAERAADKPNEFDPAIELLIEKGEGKRIPLDAIPEADVAKTKRRITEAAHRHDKSARFTTETTEDGVIVRFSISERIVKRNKKDDTAPVAEAVDADA